MSESSADPYDTVAYHGAAWPQAHPDRMATLATLFGLTPAPVERCRVLELGCGDGAHLIAAAVGLPDSTFVGVDLAAAPVARGQEEARALGLHNVALRRGDVCALTAADGAYDYVVAHGLYSWVPAEVRDRVLAVCGELLAPHGVAYFSYNTYPGCHVRKMLWEMMRFHARAAAGPEAAVGKARELLEFLSAGHPGSGDGFAVTLRQEVERLQDDGDAEALYHDDLAGVNEPVYFRDFVAHAGRHGLQYLAESDYFEMQDRIYPPKVAEALRALGREDRLLREQYLDFLKARRFRRTLLCRAGLAVDAEPPAERVRKLAASSPAKAASAKPDLRPKVVEEFRGPRGGVLRVDLPLAKAALLTLGAAWPARLPFAEVRADAAARLGRPEQADEDHTAALAEVLLSCYSAGMVELHVHVPRLARKAGEKPVASPLARRQLRHGDRAATLLHTTVRVEDPLSRFLIQLLDGTRDRAALLAALAGHVNAQGRPAADRAAFLNALARNLDQDLDRAAALGLLLE
jgi:SAM-dependent methyltransferase